MNGEGMAERFGTSLGYSFNGYGIFQGSGMNIWQAARAETRTREEIELSKSQTLGRAAKAGYLPFRPDAAGLTFNYNLIGISGGAGSITIGYVGNDFGIWTTNGVGIGSPDASWGISFFNAEYRGDGVPTMESFMGTGKSGGLGIGPFSVGYSQGLNSQGAPVWHSYSGGVGIGGRTFTIVSGQYQPYNYTAPIYKW